MAGAGLLAILGTHAFRPYFGTLNPILATALAAALGVAALSYLESRRWFAIHRPLRSRGPVLLAAASAAVLVVPVIIVDLLGGFPRDINVEAPESVLFYPVIAFVAEVAFHAAPLAVLLAVLSHTTQIDRDRLLWGSIIAAALIEPLLQVAWATDKSPGWATAYVGFHVLVINLMALYLLKRYDFLTTYLFRVCYYLGWHILWGVLRLRLLFGG